MIRTISVLAPAKEGLSVDTYPAVSPYLVALLLVTELADRRVPVMQLPGMSGAAEVAAGRMT